MLSLTQLYALGAVAGVIAFLLGCASYVRLFLDTKRNAQTTNAVAWGTSGALAILALGSQAEMGLDWSVAIVIAQVCGTAAMFYLSRKSHRKAALSRFDYAMIAGFLGAFVSSFMVDSPELTLTLDVTADLCGMLALVWDAFKDPADVQPTGWWLDVLSGLFAMVPVLLGRLDPIYLLFPAYISIISLLVLGAKQAGEYRLRYATRNGSELSAGHAA